MEEKDARVPCQVVGIDLGTSYSSVAVMTSSGTVQVFANSQGERCTPSVVAFTEDPEILVGEAAKWQSSQNPANTVAEIKRLIGRRWTDPVVVAEKDRPTRTVQLEKTGENVHVRVERAGKVCTFSPEEISAEILKSLKKTAEAGLNLPVTKAVITVPAYFTDAQRQATMTAGKLAGLEVLNITNEPTAAAIAYMLSPDTLAGPTAEKGCRTVLAYDFGGGTFDVSILRLEGKICRVVATGGDGYLGGTDLDDLVATHLISVLKSKYDKVVGNNKSVRDRLRKASEQAKRYLSVHPQAVINIEGLEGVEFQTELSRAKFESLCRPVFTRTMDLVKQVLKDAKLEPRQIDDVLLIGGSSRIPKLQSMLQAMFPKQRLHSSINPDEVVSYGAAVLAAQLVRYTPPHALLVDVTPLSLGIETGEGELTVVVPRNTSLPCKKTHSFTNAVDNQTTARFNIYQGERPIAKDNLKLGSLLLKTTPGPKNSAKLTATFRIDTNGVVHVTTTDQASGNELSLVLLECGGRLSAEEVKQRLDEAAQHAKEDKERIKVLQAVDDVQSSLYWIQYFLLNMNDISTIQRTAAKAVHSSVEEWLNKNKGKAKLPELEAKQQELKTFHDSLFSAEFREKARQKRAQTVVTPIERSQIPGERIAEIVKCIKEYLLPKLNAADLRARHVDIQKVANHLIDMSVGGLQQKVTTPDDLTSFVLSYHSSIEAAFPDLKKPLDFEFRQGYFASLCAAFERACSKTGHGNLVAAARSHLALATMLFKRAVVEFEHPDEFKSTLGLLNDCDQWARRAQSRAPTDNAQFAQEWKSFFDDYHPMISRVQSAQYCNAGHRILSQALHDLPDGSFPMELVFSAIDHFAWALVIAKGHDLEAEARALHGLGKVYGKVLKADKKAKEYFARVLELAEMLKQVDPSKKEWVIGDWSKKPWFIEVKDAMHSEEQVVGPDASEEAIRSSEKFKGWIKAIEAEKDPVAKLLFIYNTHPPKTDSKLNAAGIFRTLVLQATADYFPSLNPPEQYGLEWHLLCTDISAMLNQMYGEEMDC